MNIIFTVNTYYPCKDGVQAVTGYLAEGLVQRGHRVTVVTCAYGNEVLEENYHGVDIIRVNVHTVHAMYRGDIAEYRSLILEKAKDADVLVNVCTQQALTDVLFPILDKISCKKVLYMHGMYDRKWHWDTMTGFSDVAHKIYNNIRWRNYYKVSGKYFRLYDRVIQLHQFDAANLYFKKKYHIDSDVIENAAADVFFDKNLNTEHKVPEVYAICVANYMPRKNQEFVLRAFYEAKLPEKYELIFIGSERNDYYEKLLRLNEELEQQYGKRRIHFLYGVPREETIEYIKSAKVYLMGSKWEAFPISIVESMAAAVPFITTDVGCVRYLPGGVVVENTKGMAYWLEVLTMNEGSRESLGRAGVEYAGENLSILSKVKQLEYILEK